MGKNNRTTREQERLDEPSEGPVAPWQLWGPYVSERAWGTVREDYSAHGNAWDYFPHDLARSKTYRWGEDGLAGICDRYQTMVFSLALWNGKDPILKERLFGVVPNQSNHGEDVKEYYYYLDATPTHSYLKYLYKYPQAEYPYGQLISESSRRQKTEGEYELVDTGVFNDDRYFDVFVEYAKSAHDDLSIKIEVVNRGPEAASLHVLPHLWYRNTWSWGPDELVRPEIKLAANSDSGIDLIADDSKMGRVDRLPFPYQLGTYHLHAPAGGEPLFADNETNGLRVWGSSEWDRSKYPKDAFHRYMVQGEECINPAQHGTKACINYHLKDIPPRSSRTLYLRLSPHKLHEPLANVEAIVSQAKLEADEFYATIQPPKASEDEKRIQRQALAGMIWSKQIYLFHVNKWLQGDDPSMSPPSSRNHIRNAHWRHLNSMRVLSMPDKWEYPWFAAWDLAFHSIPLALVDPEFAKEQLWFLLFEQFIHPNGQIPAYEWEFSDLNPPVQAWAVWRVYNMDRERTGKADVSFLERCFHKLMLNFTWWVNRVDSADNNVFEGGFLGLDNITVIDRSEPIPGGASLKQSDGTGWMGMFCLNLMRIALELAKTNKSYEALATKFFQHYVYVGAAMKKMGGGGYELWSETDGFFYDALCYPDGSYKKFRVRSLVGLIPLYAIERLEESWLEPFAEFRQNLNWFLNNRQDIVQRCVTTVDRGTEKVHILSIMTPEQMKRLLSCVWDSEEFRSTYGLRSLSKIHEKAPFVFGDKVLTYEPGESPGWLKGGNSNWRGPIWFPTTFLMIESLRKLRKAYGDHFEIPISESGETVSINDLASEFAEGLIRIFAKGKDGRRPVFGDVDLFQSNPHWRDYLHFYEYFHGETGQGLGASHQTGWTGLIANIIDEWRS